MGANMKMRHTAVIVALTVLLVLASAGHAAANDSALGGVGGAIKPITVSDIHMESEAVQLILYSSYAAVRVDFTFVNSGPERSVKLGFPFELPYEQQDASDLPRAAGFRAWQDGKPLSVTWTPPPRGDTEPAEGYIGYYMHEATFKTGETMIRVEYLADPNTQVPTPDIPAPPAKYVDMMSSQASYEYWVHTGVGWGDTIGKSVIRYTLTDDFQGWGIETAQKKFASQPALAPGMGEVALAYERPDANTYQWTFLDYEPTVEKGQFYSKYDTSLHYFQPNWVNKDFEEASLPGWPPDRVVKAEASSYLKLDEYEYVPDAAFNGIAWAWAEGAKGSGAGEWVKATFAGERTISEIRILPGYAKSPALFAKYNRPKTLTVEFSDGTKKTLALTDEAKLQTFPVSAKATWAKITIGDVYRGTTRDETYISLVDFGKARAPAFKSFEAVMGLESTDTDGPGSTEATGSANGTSVVPGVPGWVIVAVVVAAGLGGLAVVGGLVLLMMRGRKP